MTTQLHDAPQYAGPRLDPATCPDAPSPLFAAWLAEALATDPDFGNAMTLATVGLDGAPSVRIVLLKEFDAHGFVFFTNYTSRKGVELAARPRAALLFHWPAQMRQVRVTGAVERVSPAEADAYFAVRPRASQLAAIASPQSQPITAAALEARLAEVARAHAGGASPVRPATWGGYRLRPAELEFWQGQPSRLHDRVSYQQNADGTWMRVRLAP
jgi:pyridoxamine 5'-phosphate oxidase